MNQFKARLKLIHLIGVGGSGMSGIAEVLHNLGYKVSGSDLLESEVTKRLSSIGIKVNIGHSKKNVNKSDLIVISSAIKSTNEELVYAKNQNIPIIGRAEMLSGLMNLKYGIAVAGTHGKTTTTSILASIFTEAKLDPTFIIGGIVNSYDTSAKLGQGKYLIVEADESDQSFLELQPSASILTNIEADHLVNYGNNMDSLNKAFIKFVKKLPFDGLLVAFGDDPIIKKLLPNFSRTTVTYGYNLDNTYVINEHGKSNHLSNFSLSKQGKKVFSSGLKQLGRHNTLNAVAATIMSLEEGIDIEIIKSALENFDGVKRRMEIKGNLNIGKSMIRLIDDYGHHPTEVDQIINTVRKHWPSKKITMIFQPHRYTRTKEMFEEFSDVLSKVDILLLMDIYSAGEEKIAGITSKALADSITSRKSNKVYLVRSNDDAIESLIHLDLDGSVLITQGAGDISILTNLLSKEYG